MTQWRGLVLILLAFGLLAVTYSLTTPLFEAPDEPWHYAYVRWVAEGHGLPRMDDEASGAHQQVAQPPLYYLVAALFSSPVADDDLAELFWHNPQFGYQAGGTVNDNKNMLIHTARERFPWRDAVLAVRLARLVSLAFGLLTVGATYGIAHEALPGQPRLALVAAGVVAFTPQFLFISGVASNDSATAATATCALWALARIVRLGPTPRRAAMAGLAMGLALLSKTSTLLLLPLAVLALGLASLRADARGRQGATRRQTALSKHTLTRWGGYAVLMLGLAGMVGGWWYLRNWIAFGDPLGLSAHVNTPWGRTTPPGLTTLLSELPQVFRSFWGAFGWGHIELPPALYLVLAGLVTLALLGWIRHLFQLRKNSTHLHPLTARISLLCALWFLAVLIALLRWMWQVEAPHGRLLFPALGGWALLLTVGWSSLGAGLASFLPMPHARSAPVLTTKSVPVLTARSGKRYLPLASVAGLFILSVLIPPTVIQPAFAHPRLLPPQEAQNQVTSQNLDYGDRARLLGYRVVPESVKAGQQIKVTLCWQALQPMDKDYTLFIHLLGQDNLRVAERTTFPGQGRFPTSLWPVGRAFCETLAMHVAPWAPAPELYALEVGLYDAADGQRLPIPDEPPTVGLVRVTPGPDSAHTWLTTPTHTLSYELGGQIALVGYNSSTSLASSDTLTLTLYWQAHQVPQGDYKVFVHLLDETGEIVAQDDTPPRGGRYPTRAWQPGDLVPDTHQLDLPAERPPGPYRLFVGMYQPETGERLPVIGPEGPVPNDALLLPIDVIPSLPKGVIQKDGVRE